MPRKETTHAVDRLRRCIHRVESISTVHVKIDQTGSDVETAGVDRVGLRLNKPYRINPCDSSTLDNHTLPGYLFIRCEDDAIDNNGSHT